MNHQRIFIEINIDGEMGVFHKKVSKFIQELSTYLNVSLIGNCKKVYIGHGLSAFQAWKESGVSIHTWPEFNFITVDIFTCKPVSINKLKEFFNEVKYPFNKICITEVIQDKLEKYIIIPCDVIHQKCT